MTDGHAPVGAIVFADGVDVDAVLAEVVGRLRGAGLVVAGLAQRFGSRGCDGKRAMWLDDLTSGEAYRIDQPLGPGASGCVLDEAALLGAAVVLRRVAEGAADVVVVNRFGKAEAAGRGLRDEIAAIVLVGTPVLIAGREDMKEAWEAFIGEGGASLESEVGAIVEWVLGEAMAVGR